MAKEMTIEALKDEILHFMSNYSPNVTLENGMLTVKFSDSDKEFFLTEKEFDDICVKTSANKSANTNELYNDNYYEVILIEDSYRHIRENDILLEDKVNHITYHHDKISNELTLLILLSWDDETKRNLRRRLPIRYFLQRKIEETENTNVLTFLSELLRYNSLKIITQNSVSIEKFRSYATAYAYAYMYNLQMPIYLVNDNILRTNMPMSSTQRRDFSSPMKVYNSELVEYYSEAMSSTILPHKYLSFYHILEYFYEKIFSEDQIKKAREILTDVSFSYKREKDMAKLIKSIQQKSIDRDVTINEKVALALLIQKHINQSELKERLIERYGEEYLVKLNNKVSFSDGNPIIFSNDESQFVTSLKERIYKTRNAIVHSKESFVDEKKNNKYKRLRDEMELIQETRLIQVMAEIMINEDSKQI